MSKKIIAQVEATYIGGKSRFLVMAKIKPELCEAIKNYTFEGENLHPSFRVVLHNNDHNCGAGFESRLLIGDQVTFIFYRR